MRCVYCNVFMYCVNRWAPGSPFWNGKIWCFGSNVKLPYSMFSDNVETIARDRVSGSSDHIESKEKRELSEALYIHWMWWCDNMLWSVDDALTQTGKVCRKKFFVWPTASVMWKKKNAVSLNSTKLTITIYYEKFACFSRVMHRPAYISAVIL